MLVPGCLKYILSRSRYYFRIDVCASLRHLVIRLLTQGLHYCVLLGMVVLLALLWCLLICWGFNHIHGLPFLGMYLFNVIFFHFLNNLIKYIHVISQGWSRGIRYRQTNVALIKSSTLWFDTVIMLFENGV
jgi:hypothetical protein